MKRPADNPKARALEQLLQRASRALGLHLCFHDRLRSSGLPKQWTTHTHPACESLKYEHADRCLHFDTREVHRALAARPEGRVHTCPMGVTEIVVPVIYDGLFAGVLFAGGCWRGRGKPPHPSMVPARERNWCEDRLTLLRGVARQMADLLWEQPDAPKGGRREAILEYLRDHMDQPIHLPEAAGHLSLSLSRARHVIRATFGMTFSALVRSVKLREAAYHLRTTDESVGEVAWQVGYADQNYFTRIFTREYDLSPRAYRQRYRAEP